MLQWIQIMTSACSEANYLLQYVVVCCSVLRCVEVCCNVCCNVLQYVAVDLDHATRMLIGELCVAVCCNVCCSVLQCVAVCCSVLQCVAVSIGTHCNSLQRTSLASDET